MMTRRYTKVVVLLIVGCLMGAALGGFLIKQSKTTFDKTTPNFVDLASNMCVDTIKSEVKSPNGVYTATLLVWDCGATTEGPGTMIILRASSQKLDTKDIDSRHNKNVVLTADSAPSIRLQWQADSNLLITLPPNAELPGSAIHIKRLSWNRVTISYKRTS